MLSQFYGDVPNNDGSGAAGSLPADESLAKVSADARTSSAVEDGGSSSRMSHRRNSVESEASISSIPSEAPTVSYASPGKDVFQLSTFDPDKYFNSLLKRRNLRSLIDFDNELAKEVLHLDGNMQQLVYENYNKFIAATQTIRNMKENVSQMDEEMEKLRLNVENIDKRSEDVNSYLRDSRKKVEKLAGVHRLLTKMQFLFELPSRLEQCIASGAYESAVHYYSKSIGILRGSSVATSFASIAAECEEIMHGLKVTLRTTLSTATEDDKVIESAKLLMRLGEPDSVVRESVLSWTKGRMQACCRDHPVCTEDTQSLSPEDCCQILESHMHWWTTSYLLLLATGADQFRALFLTSEGEIAPLLPPHSAAAARDLSSFYTLSLQQMWDNLPAFFVQATGPVASDMRLARSLLEICWSALLRMESRFADSKEYQTFLADRLHQQLRRFCHRNWERFLSLYLSVQPVSSTLRRAGLSALSSWRNMWPEEQTSPLIRHAPLIGQVLQSVLLEVLNALPTLLQALQSIRRSPGGLFSLKEAATLLQPFAEGDEALPTWNRLKDAVRFLSQDCLHLDWNRILGEYDAMHEAGLNSNAALPERDGKRERASGRAGDRGGGTKEPPAQGRLQQLIEEDTVSSADGFHCLWLWKLVREGSNGSMLHWAFALQHLSQDVLPGLLNSLPKYANSQYVLSGLELSAQVKPLLSMQRLCVRHYMVEVSASLSLMIARGMEAKDWSNMSSVQGIRPMALQIVATLWDVVQEIREHSGRVGAAQDSESTGRSLRRLRSLLESTGGAESGARIATDVERLFSEKVSFLSDTSLALDPMVRGILGLALKGWCEEVRVREFSLAGFQQVHVDVCYCIAASWSFIEDEEYARSLLALADEIVGSVGYRCLVRPETLETAIVEEWITEALRGGEEKEQSKTV